MLGPHLNKTTLIIAASQTTNTNDITRGGVSNKRRIPEQQRQQVPSFYRPNMMTERADNSLDFMTFLQQQKSGDSMGAPASGGQNKDASNRKNRFDSVDFVNFLQQKSMRSTDSLGGILGPGSSVFKSKDSFANGFLSKDSIGSGFMSKDWDAKPSSTRAPQIPQNIPTAFATAPRISSPREGKFAVQKSQDWIKFNTLGEYVDIPVSTNMFASTSSSKHQAKAALAIPTSFAVKDAPVQQKAEATTPPKKKKKRKRAPRKKIVPQNKQYLEYTDNDVLMGRGGKSNHHPGNMKYRQEIERLQDSYKMTDDKDEKTKISEQLVARVQSYGGNFLEKDDQGWYVIDDVVARRKVSQALREDKDPEKRRAKRQRFLAKRARLEEEARQKGFQNGA